MTLGLIMLTIARRREQLITETIKHKELEKSLEFTLVEAQKANTEKSSFLKNMSHELRTPLNSILGFSESLKLDFYGDLNKKQMEYIENIHGGGVFLLKLVTDLLHLSNIEEGKVEINPENIHISLLINKALPLLNEIVNDTEGGIIITNDIANNKKNSASVFIDQIRVIQILINLVSNAVKYGDPKEAVNLTISEFNDDFYRIKVSDSGLGIELDQHKNIFKRFNRAGQSNSKIDGVGVGLSIAKQLIEDMNGKIGFESVPGIGSTFWIDIPKSDQQILPIG
jgi:signal transduction histidine kinase